MVDKTCDFDKLLAELRETNPTAAALIRHLSDQLDEKARIQKLQNNVTDLETRVLQQERYSSKDCIIISNMPSFPGDLTVQVVDFLNYNLSTTLEVWDIKACLFLGDPRDQLKPATVIVKFVYFRH